ncbi:MAG: helix-turn-helix domain-containing protein [Peptostreptococcaceae bacterium]
MKTLKIARIKKDLTQKELAELTQMSPATINQIEKGSKSINAMRVRDVKKICDALDVDIHELID